MLLQDGKLLDYTLDLVDKDNDISAGETINYMITAIDRAGNESSGSTITAYIPNTVDKAINGGFEEGTQNWRLYTYNFQANADFEIDDAQSIDGEKSAKATVTQSKGTNQV